MDLKEQEALRNALADWRMRCDRLGWFYLPMQYTLAALRHADRIPESQEAQHDVGMWAYQLITEANR